MVPWFVRRKLRLGPGCAMPPVPNLTVHAHQIQQDKREDLRRYELPISHPDQDPLRTGLACGPWHRGLARKTRAGCRFGWVFDEEARLPRPRRIAPQAERCGFRALR